MLCIRAIFPSSLPSHTPLAFVLVNDLSLVSRCFLFWKCVRFCFCFCCRLFLFVACTCILCLLPCLTRCSFIDVLSCTPTGVSEINHFTWLDLQSLLCCAGKTRQSGYGTVTEEKIMPGDWPVANGGTLFGQTDFFWILWCWPRRCRERKCCRSPVYFLGWPPGGSRRTGCRPAGTCTVPPQSTFFRWTWSGLQNAQRNIPWSLLSKRYFI